MSYRNPAPTVDVILQNGPKVLMIRRKREPFANRLALPGGFVDEGETVEDAAKREVMEETSLEIEPIDILGVYSDPKRDPRKHVMTVVFIGIIISHDARAADDAVSIEWVDIDDIEKIKNELAFDHYQILQDYRRWRGSGGTFWSTKRRHQNE